MGATFRNFHSLEEAVQYLSNRNRAQRSNLMRKAQLSRLLTKMISYSVCPLRLKEDGVFSARCSWDLCNQFCFLVQPWLMRYKTLEMRKPFQVCCGMNRMTRNVFLGRQGSGLARFISLMYGMLRFSEGKISVEDKTQALLCVPLLPGSF